jgi:hypothetical protein
MRITTLGILLTLLNAKWFLPSLGKALGSSLTLPKQKSKTKNTKEAVTQ